MSGFTAPRSTPTVWQPRTHVRGCKDHPRAQLHNCGTCRVAVTK